MKTMRTLALGGFAFVTAFSIERLAVQRSTEGMVRAANGLLAALTPEQKAKMAFQFADTERVNWHFIPRARKGLPLKEMTAQQKTLARTLMLSAMSDAGVKKAETIMSLDLILREMENNSPTRDPELYFFSVFGTPTTAGPWGWRVEGHHISLNFTIAGGRPVATTPSFFGANPAEVRTGPRQGLRALAEEEDLARQLVTGLDSAQRTAAIFSTTAPRDIITMNSLKADPINPAGISVAQLRREQVELLVALVDAYLYRLTDDLALERRGRLGQNGELGKLTFAWAGSIERGQPHYYRVQGPSFLLEFDNTQTQANHIHSVWRDFNGDFGRDLLREHYQQTPHSG